jgi:hypothetical protein
MTATLSRPVKSENVRLYDVEGYGVIGRDNAVFIQHCLDSSSVDSLSVGQWILARFRSGMGTSTLKVARVS